MADEGRAGIPIGGRPPIPGPVQIVTGLTVTVGGQPGTYDVIASNLPINLAQILIGPASGSENPVASFDGKVYVAGGDLEIVGVITGMRLEINGDAHITGSHQVDGDMTVKGTVHAITDVVLGSDCAEDFDIAISSSIDPGTVMVFTDDGRLEPSREAYDRRVAGVISGAGEYRPGLILGRSTLTPGRLPLALIGRVYCKVDAEYAPIAVGDLLTTSATPGHAMKAVDPALGFGAVVGKALRPLESGQALIPILVALQ